MTPQKPTSSTPATDDTDTPTPDTPPQTPVDAPEDREAAKYRRRLRDAEAERDGLREQLTAVRRQAAEDASGLAKPASLWLAGVEVDSLFDAAGRLDPVRLTEAVKTATAALGLAQAPRTPKPDPSQGKGASRPRDQFATAFGPS
jgi:hypothetical protein